MTLNFTPEQEKAIQQLRFLMKDELPKEIYVDKILIYKFLKARDFNLKQAESMLRKNLRFRKALQTNAIIKDFKPSEMIKKYALQSRFGFDKEGCPVHYIPTGTGDGRGIFKSANAYCLLQSVIQEAETDLVLYKQQSKKLGLDVFQSVYIHNLEHFSLAQATDKNTLQHVMKFMTIFQDNYPETVKRIYFVNVSVYFALAFSVIKTVLASALVEKIRIYGQSGWKEDLLEIIDADVLPAFLGGTRTDPDGNPRCLTIVQHWGRVPESYHLVKDIEKTARKRGMKHIKLERQTKKTIAINIEKPKSILNWEFEVKCYDIGFGLTLEKENEDCLEELIPVEKLETEWEPLNGMYRCSKIGKYNIVFDNSHSWIHPKNIYYRTWVTDDNDI